MLRCVVSSISPSESSSFAIFETEHMQTYFFYFIFLPLNPTRTVSTAIEKSAAGRCRCDAVATTLAHSSLPISVTFICGRAHIDSCFLMREAFSWSVAATLARSPLMLEEAA